MKDSIRPISYCNVSVAQTRPGLPSCIAATKAGPGRVQLMARAVGMNAWRPRATFSSAFCLK